MKKSSKILSAACIALVAGLVSCGGDETPSVSAENAKIAFNTVNQNLADDLEAMAEAPGFTAMNSLASLTSSSSPFGRVSSYKRKDVRNQIKASLYAFRSVLLHSAANGRVSGDEPFDFDANKGVYTYNFETQDFDASLGGDIIKILYPTEGSLTNDAEFRLSAYQEVSTPNGDDLYSPTLVDASILIDEVIQAELDLEVEYGNEDQPVFADISYFITPFSVELNFDDRAATVSSASQTLFKDGETLIGFGLTVTYQTAAKNDEEIKKITGYVLLMNIRFNVSINAEDAANATDINDIINISIKIDGGDAGDIILEQDAVTGEPIPYVKYNDGTTESLESLFEDLALQLEGLLS